MSTSLHSQRTCNGVSCSSWRRSQRGSSMVVLLTRLTFVGKRFGRHATSNYSVCLAFGETKSRKHGCGSSAAALAPNLFQRADSPLFFFLVVKSAEIGWNPPKLAKKLAEIAPIQSDSVQVRRGRRKICYQKICEKKREGEEERFAIKWFVRK